MSDPSTYWLTITNVTLGIVVLICFIAVAFSDVQEVAARRRKRAALSEIDQELSSLFGTDSGGHVFNVPGLGLTMADGGERLRKEEKR